MIIKRNLPHEGSYDRNFEDTGGEATEAFEKLLGGGHDNPDSYILCIRSGIFRLKHQLFAD